MLTAGHSRRRAPRAAATATLEQLSASAAPHLTRPFDPTMSSTLPSSSHHPRAPFADNNSTVPDDRSAYSMATVYDAPSPDSRTSLLSHHSSEPSYGATGPSQPSSRKLLWNATLKMAVIFTVSTIVLGGTLWLALPTLEE